MAYRVTAAMKIKRRLFLGRKAMANLLSFKKQRHYFADKGPYSQSYSFSSSHVWMWQLDHKEGWVLKILCFWTVVLEKTLESPLDCKEMKPVNPKGNQLWIFIGIFKWCWNWSSNTLASWYKKPAHWKRPWCWERWRAGREGDNKGWDGWMASSMQWAWIWANSRRWWLQETCCSPWSCKELDTTEWLNNRMLLLLYTRGYAILFHWFVWIFWL